MYRQFNASQETKLRAKWPWAGSAFSSDPAHGQLFAIAWLTVSLASYGTIHVVIRRGIGDPGEQRAQFAAGGLDWVLFALLAQCLEFRGTGLLVFHEAGGEGAGLDIGQHSLHVFLHLWGDHAWAGDVVAALSGVADGVECVARHDMIC